MWGGRGAGQVYVTKYHHSVFHVSNSRGFRMESVRVRALPYFALSVVEAAPEQLGEHSGRPALN
eukprot:COSAG01_NODE_2483_length_7600_cov_4.742034_8_plen_64_part_00